MRIAVYGASGHTARFVIDELLRRGHTPVAIGRERERTAAALALHGAEIEIRVAGLDAPSSLERALAGTEAVINCAGPFLDTARPLVEAALRAGTHYLDITAEQASALATFERFDAPARERGIAIVPAAGFYGALADLMASAAIGDWRDADAIEVAIALDRWHPTPGTRRTGARNTAPRLVLSGGELLPLQPSTPAPWEFPAPFSMQEIAEVPFTETILMARHLKVREIHNYLNKQSLHDVRDPATPEPLAVDERGRSDQHFVVDVRARNDGEERRITVSGRDIYAITAPIVVEALERIGSAREVRAGAFAFGELDDAATMLAAIARAGELALRYGRNSSVKLNPLVPLSATPAGSKSIGGHQKNVFLM